MSSIRPSSASAATPGFAANSATTRRAWAISSALGMKHSLITRDLVGMDRELAGEAIAPRFGAAGAQARGVAKIGMQRIDRGDAGRLGAEQAQRAHQLERRGPVAAARRWLAVAPTAALRSSAPQVSPSSRAPHRA